MSPATAAKRKWTAAEYLAMERESLDKHEFYEGEVFLMPGASYEHNLIANNLHFALTAALRGRCRVFAPDLRIYIPATGLYAYPDVSVLCGEPIFVDETRDMVANPVALCEVLSGSTENYDRGKKFENYRSIPALEHYVLVAQERVLVEHFARQPGGAWLMQELREGQILRLLGAEVTVSEMYRDVPLPAR